MAAAKPKQRSGKDANAQRRPEGRSAQKTIRPEVMAHFSASIERNRRLLELLSR